MTKKKRKAFDDPVCSLRSRFNFFSDVTRDIQKMAAKETTAKRSGRKMGSRQNQFFFIIIYGKLRR